jgi:hypothetical protein
MVDKHWDIVAQTWVCCPICDKRNSRSYFFCDQEFDDLHLQVSHPELTYKCPFCQVSTCPTRHAIDSHVASSHEYESVKYKLIYPLNLVNRKSFEIKAVIKPRKSIFAALYKVT